MHQQAWEISPDFLEAFERTGVTTSELHLNLEVEKKERFMTLVFHITGNVEVLCDRCNEPLRIEVESREELIARFSNETDLTDDKVLLIGASEYKLDLSQFIYEFTILQLPLKRAHEEGECDPEVVSRLTEDEEETIDEKQIDPRWEALKNLQKE